MKLLAHIPLYLPYQNSGGEVTIHHFLKAMQNRGHEVKVIVEKIGKEDSFEGIPIERLNYLFGDRRQLIQEYKWADVVYTHLGSIGVVDNIIRHDVLKPVVYYAHNNYRSSAVQRSDFYNIVYNSKWVRESLEQDYGKRNSIVANPPIDFSKLKKKAKGKYITIINANENKGGYQFRDIAKAMPDEQFLIVKGGYGTQVVFDLPENVTVIENTPDLSKVWNDAKIVLMPSLYESFGRVAIESNYLGIPLICTPTKGLLEATLNEGNYCMRDDIDSWVKMINKINKSYKKYSDKAKEIGFEASEQNKIHTSYFCNFVENICHESKSTKSYSYIGQSRSN